MLSIVKIELPHRKMVFHRIRDFNAHMVNRLREEKTVKVDEYVRLNLEPTNDDEELPTVMANVTFIKDYRAKYCIRTLREWSQSEYCPMCFQQRRGKKVYKAVINWDMTVTEELAVTQ